MKTVIVLAWRNLWRNKRRTFITLASVVLAVALALIMRAMQLGSYDKMVRNVAETYTGYIQVHRNGYWNDKTLDNSFGGDSAVYAAIRPHPGISALAPRLENFALASVRDKTKGVMVTGINPREENKITNLSKRITKGSYLSQEDQGALVAEDLAQYFSISVGDTLVLLGQGYHGISAAGKYAVRGLVHFAVPDLNSTMVYLSLPACRTFFSAQGRLTSVVINLSDPGLSESLKAALLKKLGPYDLEVLSWQDMLREMVQQIRSDNAAGLIMLGILYLIVAFGIFGTITMMTLERRKEFGILVALGMSRLMLSAVVFLETIFIAVLGTLAGIAVSIPIILYFTAHPIRLTGEMAKTMVNYGIEPVLPLLLRASVLLHHGEIVLALTLLSALYPLMAIAKMEVVKSMRI